MSTNDPGYTVREARYARGMMLVGAPSVTGFKSRAARLLGALRCRFTNRERGYIVSPAKLARFERLYFLGHDAGYFGEFRSPAANDNGERLTSSEHLTRWLEERHASDTAVSS
jgi:hypothetical protein